MKPIDLFGTGFHASSNALASELLVNCYYDVRKESGGTKISVRGTPGSFPWIDIPGSPIRGARVVGAVLYVVAGATVYSVTVTGVTTALGVLTTNVNRVQMQDNYAQLMIVDGAKGYIVTIATGVLAQISDVNFPNGATTVFELSGRFIVESPLSRAAYVSAALDGMTWTALGASMYFTKEQHSDLLYSISGFGSLLIAFGTSNIEFWQDAGLSPMPFQFVSGSSQPYGLVAKYSPTPVDKSLMFLGVDDGGGIGVFSLELTSSLTPNRVSTSDVEDYLTLLSATQSLADAVGLSYTVNGHSMYQLTFPTANRSILLDATTGIWSSVQTGVTPARHFADGAVIFNSKTLVWDKSTTKLSYLSALAYSDGGQALFRQATSKHLRNGGLEFSIAELQLEMDSGVVPEASNYHIELTVSKDGGDTFGSPRLRTMGRVGQYRTPRVKWDRLGSTTDFVLRFTMTDPIPFVIVSANADIPQ
jgi:hypothetical protein